MQTQEQHLHLHSLGYQKKKLISILNSKFDASINNQ